MFLDGERGEESRAAGEEMDGLLGAMEIISRGLLFGVQLHDLWEIELAKMQTDPPRQALVWALVE
jgi:hypothetical protein